VQKKLCRELGPPRVTKLRRQHGHATAGRSLERVPFEGALPFIEQHYAQIFGAEENGARFLASPMTEAKRRFCEESDVFLFRTGTQTVGLLMGNPIDWSSYYIRSTALLSDYRGRNLGPMLVELLSSTLRAAGVERLEADVSPTNLSSMRGLCLDLGFVVTSTSLSERWGGLIHLTRLLSEEASTVFHRQFCNHPRSTRSRSSPTSNPERRNP